VSQTDAKGVKLIQRELNCSKVSEIDQK